MKTDQPMRPSRVRPARRLRAAGFCLLAMFILPGMPSQEAWAGGPGGPADPADQSDPGGPADTSAAKGLQIARDARSQDEGFGNFSAGMTMVLRNKKGQESVREVGVKVLEAADDGNKSLFVFDQPRDARGTALLIHGHKDRPDDQWLYLPALKRVKRISSSNRSGSFMGSEFTYEDMTVQEVEKYTYRYLRDEPCGDDLDCVVTERIPVEKGSVYRRQLVWRDKSALRVWKVEYYDRKDAHLKTLTLGEYRQYLDRYWRAGSMAMVNHLTGKSTDLVWTDYQFGTDIDDRDFTRTGLRRVR